MHNYNYIATMEVGFVDQIRLRWHAPLNFKSNKPGVQADRLLCLCKRLAHIPFWESSTIHCP